MTGTTSARSRRSRGRLQWWLGLAVAILCAGVISGFAFDAPDGLEWVAHQLGFADAAAGHAVAGGPLAGYRLPGVGNARLSGGLAGVLGTLVVLAISLALARVLGRRRGAVGGGR